MTTIAATITVMMVIMCLSMLGVLTYSLVTENPDVEGVSFTLSITAIIIGVLVSIVALALD